MIGVLQMVLCLVALALAGRLIEAYAAERASHDLTAQVLADAVAREGEMFEAGVQLGRQLQAIHISEDATMLVPVMEALHDR